MSGLNMEMDQLFDLRGRYTTEAFEELKEFIDKAIAVRIEEINHESLKRLERFKSDAIKHREDYDLHFNDKPDPKLFGVTDDLQIWHHKAQELEGKALTYERQYSTLSRKLEIKNDDLLKRQARRYVSTEQHPEKYQEYLQAKKDAEQRKIISEFSRLNAELDRIADSDTNSKNLKVIARKLVDVISRLEKSEVFADSASNYAIEVVSHAKEQIKKADQRESVRE